MSFPRSSYETAPVADILEAVAEWVGAYNRLQNALAEEAAYSAVSAFAEQLRKAAGQSVPLEGARKISPYEAGVAIEAAPTGQLAVNTEKLRRALEDRPADTRALFVCGELGLLPGVLRLLHAFKNNAASLDDAAYWEKIYPPLMRFMNECRRLHVFWWD